jgi:hypothetical protein
VTFPGIVNGTSGNIIESMTVGHFKVFHVDWSAAGEGPWAQAVTLAHRIDEEPSLQMLVTVSWQQHEGKMMNFQVPFGVL